MHGLAGSDEGMGGERAALRAPRVSWRSLCRASQLLPPARRLWRPALRPARLCRRQLLPGRLAAIVYPHADMKAARRPSWPGAVLAGFSLAS